MKKLAPIKKLRTGFTTGACVTAASVVAYEVFKGASPIIFKKVLILFPDKKIRSLDIFDIKRGDNFVKVSIKKDAGDDIDITNGAIINAKILEFDGVIDKSDIVISKEGLTVILRRGNGVGLITTDMLDVPNGKVSINPTPQNMIFENIKKVAGNKETVLIEVSIGNGKALAKRTLNSILGVIDGLSILGTSGIVIPCSHDAYKTTIDMLIKGVSRSLKREVIAVTGGKTHRLIKALNSNFPEEQIVRFGDFIEEIVKKSEEYGILKLTIGCMPGKLAKYAIGYGYTHANSVRTEFSIAADILFENGVKKTVVDKLRKTKTVREFILSCSKNNVSKIFDIWAKRSLQNFKLWNEKTELKIVLFGFNSEFCGEWRI